jgi:hypothetical protein
MTPLPPPRLPDSAKTPDSLKIPKKRLGLGFGQPQATMREFVILLILLFGCYAALHLFIPSKSALSLFRIKSDKMRSPVLQEIGVIKNQLKDKENALLSLPTTQSANTRETTSQSANTRETASQSVNTRETASQSANPRETASQSGSNQSNSDKLSLSLKSSNENSLLTLKTIEKWRDNLGKSNISKKEDQYLTDLALLFNQLESKDLKKENLSVLFLNINKNLVNFESSLENSLEQTLFWTGNGKWLEVVLWSLFGTLLYIIQQTSEYYLATNSNSSSDKSSVSRVLIRRKPQYYYFLFQSPFTALVILWILSMANLNIAGIALALSSAPSEVLISLAFILGLYNRVANTQLNLIVASIFGDAWKKTVRKIEIQKYDDPDSDDSSDQAGDSVPNQKRKVNDGKITVFYRECVDFDVLPDVKVTWSIISKPSVGIINPSTGTYIAPPEGFYYNEDKELKEIPKIENPQNSPHPTNYKQDIIEAVREDEESVRALALIILDKAPQK